MNYNYEYLATITKAIQDLAEARAYDWYMFWLGVFGIIISSCIAGLAARYAYKLNEEQKKIAEKQADIMKQQNKVALFEIRYKIYIVIENFLSNIRNMHKHYEKHDVTKIYMKPNIICENTDLKIPKLHIFRMIFFRFDVQQAWQKEIYNEDIELEFITNFNYFKSNFEKIKFMFSLETKEEIEKEKINMIFEQIDVIFNARNSFFDENSNLEVANLAPLLDIIVNYVDRYPESDILSSLKGYLKLDNI